MAQRSRDLLTRVLEDAGLSQDDVSESRSISASAAMSQEAYNLRVVLRTLEEARRALCYLAVPYAHHRERLNQVTRDLCAEHPELARQIDAWEAKRHQDVELTGGESCDL